MDQDYLNEMKSSGVIFGGGELERHYQVEVPRRGERVCFINLNHPRVPHWLWVNELHPNALASIRCFELVTSFLELPQEPESSNTAKKTKKGYISVRPTKGRKIFGLYEDSFHGFKVRYFKIIPVGDHRPFWLSLEGDGRFPPYWTDRAGFDVAPVTYEGLRAEQRETVNVLTTLFSE
ncbi:hypothetical protein PIB30_034861 [Stylosanthes scabra]|uniref:Uncharacterized protein n=1 Tax=Stylosanthes scabra TaxID=79078 RepID=A0ABU6QCT9_9FABA|nr:hypothetical protein [Stylosanthes scabra]